jgi:hypothetical protein
MAEAGPTKDDVGWASVIKLLLHALGGAAKYAVIVAGLLVALYFFIEQQSKIASEAAKARQEAEKLNEDKLRDADERLAKAQTQLVETYERFQEIGTKQVNSLKELLAFRESVEQQSRDKAEEVQRLKSESERLTVELEGKNKIQAAQAEELKVQKLQVEKARQDFEQEKRQKEEADRARIKQLTDRAETYNRVRDKLIDLATKVESTQGSLTDDTKKLARDILEATKAAEQRLADFISNPNSETFNQLKSIIIGTSSDDVMGFDFGGQGAALYACENNQQKSCIIVSSQDDFGYSGILSIDFEKNIVVDIDYITKIVGIFTHDINDWNKQIIVVRVLESGIKDTELVAVSTNQWTIMDLAKSNGETLVIKFDRLNKPASSLSVEQYRKMLPDDYRSAVLDNSDRGEPAVNFAMEGRAANFKAANVAKAVAIPAEILVRFNHVADAAVSRDDISTVSDTVEPSIDTAFMGRLAAVLLKRDFQITGYEVSANDTNSASIVAEFHPLETGTETTKATIRFHRATADAAWRLSGLDIATK